MTLQREAVGRPADVEEPEGPPPWPADVLDALEQGVVALDRERRVAWNNRRIEELLAQPETFLD